MTASIIALPARPEPSSGTVYMDASIRPNRSLSQHGFKIVMLSMAAMSFFAGLGFLSIGAWPVVGFFGLDVVLVYLAFKVNFKAGAREHETVRVTGEEVLVSRTCYRGFTAWWRVSPAFARVRIDHLNEQEAAVHLTAGGVSVPLATCLSTPERLAFAQALQKALKQAQSERHPQAHQGA